MTDLFSVCRLCKGSKHLSNMYDMDDDAGIHFKTAYCLDLKIVPEDGLPSMICRKCKKKIQKFYNFKQECLKVDYELRILKDSFKLEAAESNEYHSTWELLNSHHTSEFSPNNVDESNIETNENLYAIEYLGDTSSLQCEVCGGIFKSKNEFKRHVASHQGKKLFQCKYCPKQFKRAESNTIHMRSHFGIRPFICEICGQSSTKRQDLIRHMKIHNEERNHECHTCGRRFKRSGDLCSHIRTHSGTRPYKCKICDKDYTSHSGLRKHNKTHYKKEPE